MQIYKVYFKNKVGNFEAMANGALLKIAMREFGVSEKQTLAKNLYHFVNEGDTLYSLAKTYDESVSELQKWNNLTNDLIVAGQNLRVQKPEFKEITESRILQYAKETGISGITSDNDAWCGIYAAWCCMKAGLPYPKSPSARAWLDVGAPVTDLSDADIIVYWRGSKDSIYGHVGIPITYTDDKQYINTLGGNQSNSVCVKPYPVARLLGLRKLI